MKAIWNGTVVAESDDIVKIEGNAYSPAPKEAATAIKGRFAFWKGVEIVA